jgi:hypothetical protein
MEEGTSATKEKNCDACEGRKGFAKIFLEEWKDENQFGLCINCAEEVAHELKMHKQLRGKFFLMGLNPFWDKVFYILFVVGGLIILGSLYLGFKELIKSVFG